MDIILLILNIVEGIFLLGKLMVLGFILMGASKIINAFNGLQGPSGSLISSRTIITKVYDDE